MSTIFLDPVQMDATAGHVGGHVDELTTLTADLETACSAVVPASIAGWLAEELRDIAVTVRMIALLYSVAALDTAQRAQQIQADQSLATAVPAPGSTSAAFTETVMGGFTPLASGSAMTVSELTGGGATQSGGFVLAPSTPGFGAVEMRMQTAEEFRASNPLLAAAERMQHTNPSGAAQLMGVHAGIQASQNLGTGNDVAPRGLDLVAPRIFEDETGRQGGLGQTYRDPRTGDLRF